MIESRNATWLRDWAIEWSPSSGELWISCIRRCADGWTRTVTFDARPTGLDVERVAAVVDRMPAVEATIEIPRGDAASAGIRVTHSEAQEPSIAEISALVVQLPRRPMRIEIAHDVEQAAQPAVKATELAQATSALAEARAKCDELRDALANTQSTLDEALRVQGTIWDAVGGQRDAAYRHGQKAMRAHAAVALDARGACSCAELVRSLPLAKAPTVSASEVTGEAIPGGRAAETAGAGESVARSVDLATIWKGRAGGYRTKALNEADANKRGYHDGVADAYATCADEIGFVCGKLREELAGARVEIDRLNRCLRDSMEQLAEESERWRAATGCESPAKASAFVARINEAAKLLRD